MSELETERSSRQQTTPAQWAVPALVAAPLAYAVVQLLTRRR